MNYIMFLFSFLSLVIGQINARMPRSTLYKLARSTGIKPIKARELIKPIRVLSEEKNYLLEKCLSYTKDEKDLFKIINKPLLGQFFDVQYFSIENRRGLDDAPAYKNQDRGIIGACAGRGILGVFDGHGKETGGVIARYVRDRLPLQLLGVRTPQAACSVCLALQEEIKDKMAKEGALGGTTALVGLLQPHHGDQFTLSIVNVGDSRAMGIVSGVVTQLSHDHKPSVSEELIRIKKAGGTVRGGYVYSDDGYGLALSRSLGDLPAHDKGGVIAEPEVITYKISKGDILVFATDGLWDFFSHQEVAAFIMAKSNKKTGKISTGIAKELAQAAFKKGSKDDITVIIAQV